MPCIFIERGVRMSEEPVILITKPEKQLIEKDNLEIEINNYDNSHLYYKGFDLGTFKEIVNLRQENKILKEKNKQLKGLIDKAVLELANIDGNLSNGQLSDRICNLIDILNEVSE